MRRSVTSAARARTGPRIGTGPSAKSGCQLSPSAGAFVPTNASAPHPLPPERTDLGCKMVAGELSAGLKKGTQNAISLQISGGPQGGRTPDLRRANPATSVLLIAS